MYIYTYIYTCIYIYDIILVIKCLYSNTSRWIYIVNIFHYLIVFIHD